MILSNDFVKIIDQRLLPHELKIVNLNSLTEAVFAIKEMLGKRSTFNWSYWSIWYVSGFKR